MKFSFSNIVLLAACCGVAYELWRMLAQMLSGVELELPSTPAGTIHTGRKAWLKSDLRNKMEAVAVAQGWIQYTDPKTRRKFWHCHVTNESYHELVFVGETNVYLNRWCSSDGTKGGATNNPPALKSRQSIDHLPTPDEFARHQESRIRPAAEGDSASELISLGSIPIQASEVREDVNIITADDESSADDNNYRIKRKPRHKPVKGRHTRGKSLSTLQQLQQQPMPSNSNRKQGIEARSEYFEDQLNTNYLDKNESGRSSTKQWMGERNDNTLSAATDISIKAMTEEKNNNAIEAAVKFAEEKATRSKKDPLSDDTSFITRENPRVLPPQPLLLNSQPRPKPAKLRSLPQRISNSSNPTESVKDVYTPAQPNGAVKGPLLQRTSRLVFFMHLHKAAGTTLCELAVKNGHRSPGMRQDVKDARGKKVMLR